MLMFQWLTIIIVYRDRSLHVTTMRTNGNFIAHILGNRWGIICLGIKSVAFGRPTGSKVLLCPEALDLDGPRT